MPSLQDALMALVRTIDARHGNQPTPAPKPAPAPRKMQRAPKPLPKRDRSASAPAGTLPRVALGSFTGAPAKLYGEDGRHSESRPPPEHEYYPERHFGGPLYSNVQPYYPELIHRTAK